MENLLTLIEAYRDEAYSMDLLHESVESVVRFHFSALRFSQTKNLEDLPFEQLDNAIISLTIFNTMSKAKGLPPVFCGEMNSVEDVLLFSAELTQHALSKLSKKDKE